MNFPSQQNYPEPDSTGVDSDQGTEYSDSNPGIAGSRTRMYAVLTLVPIASAISAGVMTAFIPVPLTTLLVLWIVSTLPAEVGIYFAFSRATESAWDVNQVQSLVEAVDPYMEPDSLVAQLGGLLSDRYDLTLVGYTTGNQPSVQGELRLTPGIRGSEEYRAAITSLIDSTFAAALQRRQAILRFGDQITPIQQDILTGLDAQSFLLVPVIWGDQLHGVICYTAGMSKLSDLHRRHIALLATQIASAIGSVNDSRRQSAGTAGDDTGTQIWEVVSDTRDLNRVVSVFARLVGNAMSSDGAGILVVDADGETLLAASGNGPLSDWSSAGQHVASDWLALRDSDIAHGINFANVGGLGVDTGIKALGARIDTGPIAAAPLAPHGRMMGAVVAVRNQEGSGFSDQDIATLDLLAKHIGLEVENAHLYAQHREASDKLERLSMIQMGMVYNVSHELRTSLSSLKTATELLLDGESVKPGSEHFERLLQSIARNVARQETLISNVVDLASLEENSLTLNLDWVDLGELIAEISTLVAPLINQRNQTLTIPVPSGMPRILADRDRLSQVLINLISNARKFSPHGTTITVTVSGVDDDVVFSVSDEGPGVPPDERERIFDAFYRAEGRVDGSTPGSGLGLAISKALVELHEGEIWVESAPAGGASFVFSIPLEDANEATDN